MRPRDRSQRTSSQQQGPRGCQSLPPGSNFRQRPHRHRRQEGRRTIGLVGHWCGEVRRGAVVVTIVLTVRRRAPRRRGKRILAYPQYGAYVLRPRGGSRPLGTIYKIMGVPPRPLGLYGTKNSNIVASREKYNKYATASCDEHQEHVRYSAAVPAKAEKCQRCRA